MKTISICALGVALAACAPADPAPGAITSDVAQAPVADTSWYVANSNSGSVTLSLSGGNCAFFFGSVPVGASPHGVAVNPAGTRIYVTNFGSVWR